MRRQAFAEFEGLGRKFSDPIARKAQSIHSFSGSLTGNEMVPSKKVQNPKPPGSTRVKVPGL